MAGTKEQEKIALFELLKRQTPTVADSAQTVTDKHTDNRGHLINVKPAVKEQKPVSLKELVQQKKDDLSKKQIIPNQPSQSKPKGQPNLAELRTALDEALNRVQGSGDIVQEKTEVEAAKEKPKKFVSLNELPSREEKLEKNSDNDDNRNNDSDDNNNSGSKKNKSGVLKPGESVKFD